MTNSYDFGPVVVLGSSGFGGSSFAKSLLDLGATVYGFSRSAEPDECFRPYSWVSNQKSFHFEQTDLNKDLDRLIDRVTRIKPRYVVNFASQSMVGQSWDNPEDWMQTNVVAMASLLRGLAQISSLEKYIHFTTPEVYGNTDGWITESFSFAPSTPYAVSRAAGDWLVKLWQENFNVPAIFTRAANIYGEGQQLYRIIPRTVLFGLTGRKIQLHGGGKSIRAFIHMDDVSHALFEIMKNGTVGDSFHISPRESISILDLVRKIGALLDVKDEDLYEVSDDRMGKDMAYLLDSTHLSETLGVDFKVSLDQGLQRCVTWAMKFQAQLEAAPDKYVHMP